MHPDLCVVGGGAIGLGIALEAVRVGMQVAVVDPTPGRGASDVAAGMLAPITELHYGEDVLLRLNQESSQMFGEWVAEVEELSGLSCGYRSTGTLMVARDADENSALHEIWAHQGSLDLKVERLRGSEARRLEPALSPSVRGGVLVPDDHQVDPSALVAALLAGCGEGGVAMVESRAAGVRVEKERVTGVDLEGSGSVDAGAVVIAAGSHSSKIAGPPESLPVRPVKGQLVELRSPDGTPLLERNVRGREVYLVPRADGRLTVGATVEERGFDTSITAGAVHDLLRDAYEIVPGVAELEFFRARAGLRPGTPDNGPLLGGFGAEGLYAATGHYRNGILLAPVTARAIVSLVATGTTPESIAPFSPSRFGAAA